MDSESVSPPGMSAPASSGDYSPPSPISAAKTRVFQSHRRNLSQFTNMRREFEAELDEVTANQLAHDAMFAANPDYKAQMAAEALDDRHLQDILASHSRKRSQFDAVRDDFLIRQGIHPKDAPRMARDVMKRVFALSHGQKEKNPETQNELTLPSVRSQGTDGTVTPVLMAPMDPRVRVFKYTSADGNSNAGTASPQLAPRLGTARSAETVFGQAELRRAEESHVEYLRKQVNRLSNELAYKTNQVKLLLHENAELERSKVELLHQTSFVIDSLRDVIRRQCT